MVSSLHYIGGPLSPGGIPWGVATIDLKTSECGHHTLFLSQSPQHGGENRHDDRTGRIYARLSMGQARPREDPHYRRGDNRLGGAVPAGRPTRHPSRAGPRFTGRTPGFRPVASAAGTALVE